MVHATLVEVHGIGVLLTGPRGVGKSETALELIRRGHALVADDAVVVEKDAEGNPVGRAPVNLSGKLEIRLALAELYCPNCLSVYPFSPRRMRKGCDECGSDLELRPIQDKVAVDVAELFGAGAVVDSARIDVILRLVPGPYHPRHDPTLGPEDPVSNTPKEEETVMEMVKSSGGKILHVDVIPGRDIATLVEVVALRESASRRR
ncbi:MAG: hypothetical protein GXO28_04950 [Methanopyri archaeon]|nr:hypothetical protein [Methanopyri archaeon]